LRGLGIDGFDENIAQAEDAARRAGMANRLKFIQGDIHGLALDEPADLIAMNRALHHVWEKDTDALFTWLRTNLKPSGVVAIWEPAWPADRAALRAPSRKAMAFQNLTEHVQGNHFLRPDEIEAAFARAGMHSQLYLFAQGNEALVLART
jgi:trans-aconitate methyltransferase